MTFFGLEQLPHCGGIINVGDWIVGGIMLLIIGPVGIWYAQNELNKAWQAQAEGGSKDQTVRGPANGCHSGVQAS